MPGVIHVTDWEFLGAHYVVGAYPGLLVTWDHSGKDSQNRVGLADAYLVPAALSWSWPDLSVLVFEGIVAPTGYYQKDSLSAGRNVWTFDHVAEMTWTLPPYLELDLIVGYMNNLVNHATGYHSGDEFHFDYTLGHYFRDNLGLAVTGSYYRQTTADTARPGVVLAPLGEAATIGPAVMYAPRLGSRDVTMSVKWLHEFDVTGRAAQNYLIWRVWVEF